MHEKCSTLLINGETQIEITVRYQLTPVWMANSMEVPQKLKIEVPYGPSIGFLGIYLKELENSISKRYLYFYIHFSIIYNSEDMKTT